MKIPKDIENALKRRVRAAETLLEADYLISEFIKNNGIEAADCDYMTGYEMYANPQDSANRIRKAIREKEGEENMNGFLQKFNELLEQIEKPDMVLISQYDDLGNWCAFIFKQENNTMLCGGHIGICNCKGESFLTMPMFFEWTSMLRKQGIDFVIDKEWFLKC